MTTHEITTKCEECGNDIQGEIVFIISRPNKDFHYKVLGKFCSECARKLLDEYGQSGGSAIECQGH